jgi:hypothetical protein
VFLAIPAGWFATLRVATYAANRWHSGNEYIGPILLDKLFGIPYYFANATGRWHAGPSWFQTAPRLSGFCYFLWPIISVLLLALGLGIVSLHFWNGKSPGHRALAILLPLIVVALLFLIQGPIGEDDLSYFRYSFDNW